MTKWLLVWWVTSLSDIDVVLDRHVLVVPSEAACEAAADGLRRSASLDEMSEYRCVELR